MIHDIIYIHLPMKNPSEKMFGVLCHFMTVLMKQIENKSIEMATPVRQIGLIGNRKQNELGKIIRRYDERKQQETEENEGDRKDKEDRGREAHGNVRHVFLEVCAGE